MITNESYPSRLEARLRPLAHGFKWQNSLENVPYYRMTVALWPELFSSSDTQPFH